MSISIEQFLEKGKETEAQWLAEGNDWRTYRDKVWPYVAVRNCIQGKNTPSTGRTRGNFNFMGALITSPVKCEKCGGNSIFQGRYDSESELVMYAELGGVDDESNLRVDTFHFSVCLDCLHYEERIER